jgi:hypothetical protein
MGEMADYFIEQELDAWDNEINDLEENQIPYIICRRCKKGELHWKQDGVTKSGWSLYEDNNIRHSCVIKEIKERKK